MLVVQGVVSKGSKRRKERDNPGLLANRGERFLLEKGYFFASSLEMVE